jgi:CBS domain-containing protein
MTVTAADIMTTKVITAHPEDSVAKVARLLSDHSISALPICDSQGVVLGMLSEGDLIRPFGQEHVSKRAWWLNLLADGTDLAPAFLDCLRIENHPARDLMVTPVVTASPHTTLPELADLISRHRVKRLPILQDGKLVGIVSRADLVTAIAGTPDAIAESL